jgi:hypothetical protein
MLFLLVTHILASDSAEYSTISVRRQLSEPPPLCVKARLSMCRLSKLFMLAQSFPEAPLGTSTTYHHCWRNLEHIVRLRPGNVQVTDIAGGVTRQRLNVATRN